MSSPDSRLTGAVASLIAGAVATHEAVADRLGINPTDLRCLGLVAAEPGLTPTRLAELAGLTTGAITGVLDRLEGAGFLAREADPHDRRRLRVLPVEDRLHEVAAYYQPLIDRATDLSADWEPAARERLAGYLDSFAVALGQEASGLRIAARGGLVGDTYFAPRGTATHGRLVFVSGAPRLAFNRSALGQQVRVVAEVAASRLRIRSGSAADELVRAVFTGPPPDVRTVEGVVTMRYRRSLIDTRSRLATVSLADALTWSIEVDGGVTDLDADLRDVRLSGMEVRGGANHIALRLGRPDGTARIVLGGGSSEARLERPKGVAIALHLRGGASHLRFDRMRLKGVSGDGRFQSDDFASAASRYEVEVASGVSSVIVARG